MDPLQDARRSSSGENYKILKLGMGGEKTERSDNTVIVCVRACEREEAVCVCLCVWLVV